MTAPSYTEDLTDLNLAEDDTPYDEFDSPYNGQGSMAADVDYAYIQGELAINQICTKTAIGSIGYDHGGDTGGHGTDGAYFVWQTYGVASNVNTYALGGLGIIVGTSYSVADIWYTGGIDKAPYPYGGWSCNVANTTVTPDDDLGGAVTTHNVIGSTCNVLTGSGKGAPHGCDAIRMGRGSSIFEFGEDTGTPDYCTIAGFAAVNDDNSDPPTNRWGLLSETAATQRNLTAPMGQGMNHEEE